MLSVGVVSVGKSILFISVVSAWPCRRQQSVKRNKLITRFCEDFCESMSVSLMEVTG